MTPTLRTLCLLLLAAPAAHAKGPKPAPPPPAPVVQVPAEPAPPPGPDRSQPPPVADPPVFDHPEPVVEALKPGVELRFVRVPEARDVLVEVEFGRGGYELDGWETTAADAMGYLWDAATTTRDATTLSIESDLYDLSVTSGIDWHTTSLTLEVPREELARGLTLLDDVLRNPAFPKTDLKRYQTETAFYLKNEAPYDPGSLFRSAMSHTWYAPGDAYDPRPDLKALKKLKTRDLAARHAELLATAPVRLHVTGDLSLEEAKAAVAPLLTGVGVDVAWSAPMAEPARAGERLIAVDLPGATQVMLGVRTAAPAYTAADRLAFDQASYALVGPFLSRLNRNLREEKGWTYGVGGGYSPDRLEGIWQIRATISPENTAGALTEIRAELDRMIAGGALPEELQANWRESVASWNDMFLDAPTAAGGYGTAAYHDVTMAQVHDALHGLRGISPDATRAAAASWLTPTHGRVWVVVGDRDVIGAAVDGAGVPVTWVSPSDAVLGTFAPPR